jgi:hypothetical protein
MSVDQIKTYILERGEDDWVQLVDVAWSSSQAFPGATREQKVARGVEAIESLLEHGLIRVGDVRRGEGFVPWTLPTRAIVDRIAAEWKAMPDEPSLGDVCWIELTDAGDARPTAIRSDE